MDDSDGIGMQRLGLTHQLGARHSGHPLIGHDHVNRMLPQNIECLFTGLSSVKFKVVSQQPLKGKQNVWFIIHNEDGMFGLRRHSFPCVSRNKDGHTEKIVGCSLCRQKDFRVSGSITRKVVPFPGVDSNSMEPPCCFTTP